MLPWLVPRVEHQQVGDAVVVEIRRQDELGAEGGGEHAPAAEHWQIASSREGRLRVEESGCD